MKTSVIDSPSPSGKGVYAFSLLEILLTMAALSCMAAISVVSMGNISNSTKEIKLRSEVASINSAIRVYQANGGKIVSTWKADKILDELKTAADRTSAAKLAGLRGAMLDPRVEAVFETSEEAARGDAKALWDGNSQRFVIAYSGERGVKAFKLNDSLAESPTETRVRTANLELATKDNWIWDYADRDRPSTSAPATPDNPGGNPAPGGGGRSSRLTLLPPEFSLPGIDYPLGKFDLQIYLNNPNPPAVSSVQYSITPGVWVTYAGGPITIAPNDSIDVYTASTDPANWNDSGRGLEIFTTIPVELAVGLTFSKPSYTYREMGGAMIPGSNPPDVVRSGTVSLLNGGDIPSRFLNAGSLGIFSLVDGNTEEQVTLDAGFSGPVPISLASYGTGSEANFQVFARSHAAVFKDSPIVSKSVGIAPMTLRAPLIQEIPPPNGVVIPDTHWLTMSVDSQLGDMPEGARIFYTTDGSDPGDSNGLPTSPTAQLYSSTFQVTQAPLIPIRARVYAPQSYIQWFVTSPQSEKFWTPVPVIVFTMTVTASNP